jgi:channel protein (hemolysin III family)
MNDLLSRAERLALLLKDRRETVAVAESSAGGLVSAALLAVPGASAYFLGGAGFFYLKAPRYLSIVVYLLMGWIGIVAIKEFLKTMPPNAVFYLIAGAISFTVGAVFYAIKRPVFRSGVGFHEIFHFFVLLGWGFHYMLVYVALTG